jgi:hypothetical protein
MRRSLGIRKQEQTRSYDQSVRISNNWARVDDMFLHVKIKTDDKDKDLRAYHCANCGAYITNSAALIKINGAGEHSFVNPAGIQCNFRTFVECSNILISDELFLQHTWFPGYAWRFLVCGACSRHLGWKYDSAKKGAVPEGFFGVLVTAVDETAQVG